MRSDAEIAVGTRLPRILDQYPISRMEHEVEANDVIILKI